MSMPRKARIDAPGALHHIIARGIEGRKIFQDNDDRNDFLDRFGTIISETYTRCFAWALMPNHFHLLLKTGVAPIATVMRRLLTGHAVTFNRRHRRKGHLFQNRYKSILCQEDAYFLELVRYIHLNPIRARLVKDIRSLDVYPYSGHSVIMGKGQNDWQDVDWVLKLFGKRSRFSRKSYRSFVQKGIPIGKRHDLVGGGLIRSSGGWAAVKTMRQANEFQKSDERILGDGDFVQEVLSKSQEQMERRHMLKALGYDLETIAARVADLMGVETSQIWARGKEKGRVQARSLFCYWAVRELGTSMTELSGVLKISPSGISDSVKRGEQIANENGFEFSV